MSEYDLTGCFESDFWMRDFAAEGIVNRKEKML